MEDHLLQRAVGWRPVFWEGFPEEVQGPVFRLGKNG